MKEVTTPTGAILTLFSNSREMPMDRFNELRKYSLRDIGIGSDMDAVNRHHQTLDNLMSAGKFNEAHQQRINMHMSYYLNIEKINISHISFALYVNTIDGKPVFLENEEVNEEALMRICRILERTKLKHGQVEDILDDLKKKLIPNWKLHSLNAQTAHHMQTIMSKSEKKPSSWLKIFKNQIRIFRLRLKVSSIMKSI